VSHLPTGLAGCSVGPEISCGASKLVRIPWVTKKKKKEEMRVHKNEILNIIIIIIIIISVLNEN
jgi:hypothetical protein